jgi:hypothetical protein
VALGCASGSHHDPCDPTLCASGERCVQDACRPACVAQNDCPSGQNCAGWDFGDGTQGSYCVVLDYAKDGHTGHGDVCSADTQCDTLRGYHCAGGTCQQHSGQFDACSKDAECDTQNGFACVEGLCRLPCTSHFDCAAVGSCQTFAAGNYCDVSTPAKAGQYYANCPLGSECDAGHGFQCVGSGPGDLDAYCTSGCHADADCISGYRCGIIQATPCVDACGLVGQQGAGCITNDQIGAGKAFECAEPFGLMHHVCVKNSFCSPCATDEDCFTVPGQICAKDKSGQKICTFPCDPGLNSCPWGAATECGIWDKERGIPTCEHRFGACHGTGKGCEPCIDSTDCAPTGYCTRASFTGERFCVDLSVSCDCANDADANSSCDGHGCPNSPGGIPLSCYSADTQPLGHHCVGANSSTDALGTATQTGCWTR